ncbi:hypothetical protein GLOTRDRAFT_99987 [Gloeophyllum trabeum ATCC 11539]|uniref:Uncharacterized protein n=1 Tax=Gloeophyllum trabeum (strain ATCC 11539 / FP-39264 / Madison 617) TaxID=670483 RepID=S7Q6K0_GLOTA|nr:uncharacterized protein GLOTRDRAFT_99987 [Gloeophyllum trabeum ATCC 11539]EPQ55048.1 hypothetical protein GLOTRDRAFT_99987 [Gloeophyllum trabeum ATCC 11539]
MRLNTVLVLHAAYERGQEAPTIWSETTLSRPLPRIYYSDSEAPLSSTLGGRT